MEKNKAADAMRQPLFCRGRELPESVEYPLQDRWIYVMINRTAKDKEQSV